MVYVPVTPLPRVVSAHITIAQFPSQDGDISLWGVRAWSARTFSSGGVHVSTTAVRIQGQTAEISRS